MTSFNQTCPKCNHSAETKYSRLFCTVPTRQFDGTATRVELGFITPCCLEPQALPAHLRDSIPAYVCLCGRHLSVAAAIGDEAAYKYNAPALPEARHVPAVPEACSYYTRSEEWTALHRREEVDRRALREEEERTVLALRKEEEMRADEAIARSIAKESERMAVPAPSSQTQFYYTDLVTSDEEFEMSRIGTAPLVTIQCTTCGDQIPVHSVGLASVHKPAREVPRVRLPTGETCDAVVYKCACSAKGLFPSDMYPRLLEKGVSLCLHGGSAVSVARRAAFAAPAAPSPAPHPALIATFSGFPVFGASSQSNRRG